MLCQVLLSTSLRRRLSGGSARRQDKPGPQSPSTGPQRSSAPAAVERPPVQRNLEKVFHLAYFFPEPLPPLALPWLISVVDQISAVTPSASSWLCPLPPAFPPSGSARRARRDQPLSHQLQRMRKLPFPHKQASKAIAIPLQFHFASFLFPFSKFRCLRYRLGYSFPVAASQFLCTEKTS